MRFGGENPFWFTLSLSLDRVLLVHIKRRKKRRKGRKMEAWLKSSRNQG